MKIFSSITFESNMFYTIVPCRKMRFYPQFACRNMWTDASYQSSFVEKIFLSLDKKNIITKHFALESPNFWFLYTYRKSDEHHGKCKSISRFINHVIFFPNVPIDPEYISLKVLGGSRICNQDMKTFTQSISKFKWTRCHYLHKFELCNQHQYCSTKT